MALRLYEDPKGVLPAWATEYPGAYMDVYGQVRLSSGQAVNERNIGSFSEAEPAPLPPPVPQLQVPTPTPRPAPSPPPPLANLFDDIPLPPPTETAGPTSNQRAEDASWMQALNPGSLTVGSTPNRDKPKDYSAFLGGGPSQADMLASFGANQANQQGALSAITGSPAYDILNSELGRMVLGQAQNPQGLSAEERMAREKMVRSTAENERNKILGDLQANISKRGFDGPAADAAIGQAKLAQSQMQDNALAEIDMEDAQLKREEQQRAFSQFSSLLANQQQARQNHSSLQSQFGTPVFAGVGQALGGAGSSPRANFGSQKQRDFFDKATAAFEASGQDRFGRTHSGNVFGGYTF